MKQTNRFDNDFSTIATMDDLENRRDMLRQQIAAQQNRLKMDMDQILDPYARAGRVVSNAVNGINRLGSVSTKKWSLLGLGVQVGLWLIGRKKGISAKKK